MKICAITTYYNFTKSNRRYQNYLTFTKNLPFFLITVELATNDSDFQLDSNHADIYVRANSKDLLWHKESLLNIALKHIPKECDYVVWVDCDIIFKNSSLESEIYSKMEKYNLVQLFSKMYDMTSSESQIPNEPEIVTGCGISYLNDKNDFFENYLRPKDPLKMRKTLFGLAWASHKSIIKKYGFYDFCITGSGDRALYCAASGQYEVTKTSLFMNEPRFNHYMCWAENFNNLIDGKISYVDGLIVHLFHGEISDRQYRERHLQFSKFEFNPTNDLKRLEEGTFEWSNKSNVYNDFFLNYLLNRKE